ncbi:Lecithin-cholesterol acyltransferase-like 1 [Morella rubra]|uniref:Lecithin-cholesterol acyltransferase-like 1 n=1 Tax=Morella rubra TaxID=262757 RepID=A0A6A1UUG0_9ROSI|nr:Lecithin-cholesterol acyltransferase-like 1 [Morella rubra]
MGIGLALISLALMLYTSQAGSNIHPLILIPGSGGNQLEARLTAGYKPSTLFCNRWGGTQRERTRMVGSGYGSTSASFYLRSPGAFLSA